VTMTNVLLTLLFYIWLVKNISNTFGFLKGHPAQLRDYKFFLAVLLVAFFMGLATMGYKIYSKVLEGNLYTTVEEWNAIWENRLVWSVITAFIVSSIAAIWNPHRSSTFGRAAHVA